MPSPFPGMDPYLEDPHRWPDVHSRLNNAISELLARQVPPAFTVHIEERVYIVSPEESGRQAIAPDVAVVWRENEERRRDTAALIAPAALVAPLYDFEVRDRYLEIRDALGQEIVATLEVLSPANKTPGTAGHEQFLRKRRAVLASPAHWLEIDLLRAGQRERALVGRSDYCALLARGGRPGPFEVWEAGLRDRLPTIGVPLRPPYDDVPLDLQAALDLTYERGYYADKIDYAAPAPAPPLLPPDATWAAAQVRAWRAARAGTA